MQKPPGLGEQTSASQHPHLVTSSLPPPLLWVEQYPQGYVPILTPGTREGDLI